MKKTINENEFIRSFEGMDRKENFSRLGLMALFEYFEEYEESTDDEIELDVIAICCDFTEYESLDDLCREYFTIREELEKDAKYDEILDHFRDRTQLIEVSGDSIIIQNF